MARLRASFGPWFGFYFPLDGVHKLPWAVFGLAQVVRGICDRLGLTKRAQFTLCCCLWKSKEWVMEARG